MNPANHVDCTLTALRVFSEFHCRDPITENLVEALCEASRNEDDPEIQRGLNWHFYNNGQKIKNNPFIPGVRTSENRVQDLSKALREVLPEDDRNPDKKVLVQILNLSGRLLHHFQDMSTPSHVVPVYHGLQVKDEYENFGKDFAKRIRVVFVDSNGGIDPDNSTVLISRREITRILEKSSSFSPLTMYEEAAEKTLKYLRETTFELKRGGTKQTLTWSSFWRENGSSEPCWDDTKDKKGFGTFGKLGNNFGNPYFKSNGEFYEINHDAYLKIFCEMHKKSVVDSVAFLTNLKRQCSVIFEQLTQVGE